MLPWYVFAVATAILAAFAAIVEKNTLDFKDESPLEFSTLFAVLNASFSLVLLPFIDLTIPLQAIGLTYVSSIIGSTLGFLLIATAMQEADISAVSPLLNINPMFVTVFAFIFLGERLSMLQLAGIGVTMVGAYVLEAKGGFRHLLKPLKRLFQEHHARLMIAAALVYSLSSILNKFVLRAIDPVTLLFMLQLMVAFNFVAYMVYRSRGSPVDRLSSVYGQVTSRWHWVVLAALFTTSYRLLQMKAFSMAMVSLVVPIKRLSTLLATVLGGELFGEEHLLRKSIGCALMIAGAYLIIVM